MRDLIEAPDPLSQFKRSATHLAAIMVFELATLLLPLAGNPSLHDNGNVVKKTIISAMTMATTDCSHSLHTFCLPYVDW